MTGRWAYDPPDLLWQRAVSTTDHVADTIRAALAATDNDALMVSYMLAGRVGEPGLTMILDAADRGLHGCGWKPLHRTPPGTWSRSWASPTGRMAKASYLIGNVPDTGMRMNLDVCGSEPRLELQLLKEEDGWTLGGHHEVEIDLDRELWKQILAVI